MKAKKYVVAVILFFSSGLSSDVSAMKIVGSRQSVVSGQVSMVDTTFALDMVCEPQLFYRYRKDGKPGREVIINFKNGKLYGNAQIKVTVDGRTEITNFLARSDGDTVCRVLLPTGIGVDKASKVQVSLHQGNRKLKKTVMVLPMRHWNVYLYNHSHVDIGYTNIQSKVELLHKKNIIEGIKLAEETKDFPEGARFKWNPEITWPLERLLQTMPEKRESVLNAIKEGQLGIDASYLNLNTSVCSDEELFHTFSFSRKIQELTGKPIDVFQQMDVPGMSWGMVPVLAHEGVRYIMAWPNPERAGFAHKDIDQHPFWWVGPDGKSKVLFLQPGGYANSGSMVKGAATGRPWFGQRDPDKIPAIIRTGSSNVNFISNVTSMEKPDYPFDFLVLSWSLWDNSLIDADIPAAVKAWNEEYAYPHIIISGGHEIMEMIDKKYGDKLPVVKGDYTEYWTDGLGSAAGYTALNRNAKERLLQAETLWSMLRPGKPAPRDEFDEAWRYILLGSEHTWGSENPSEPYFFNAIWKEKQHYFQIANDRSQELFDEALAPATGRSEGALGPGDGPAKGGVAVFNNHSWKHGGLITLSPAESAEGDRVIDEQGNEVLAQRLSTGELVFMASDVPALGSRHYRVVPGKCTFAGDCKINQTVMENSQVRVAIDPASGNITQLLRFSIGNNVADVKVNGGLNAFRWIPANVNHPKADSDVVITTVESGPLVSELNVKSKGVGCRSVSRSVRLVTGQPYVEITNIVDKLPLLPKDGIHFGFGFDVPQSKTRVDIPWGVMEVEKEQWPQGNRNWIAMQRWLDVSNDKQGVTWCSLDAPIFEYGSMSANISLGFGAKGPWISKLEPSSTIYSWAMNNHWYTNFPLTQDGPVIFRYRILPHGAYNAVAANHFGMEQSQPLSHVATNDDPKISPFVVIDNEKVCLSIMKSLADSKDIIVRLRSLSDKPESVRLTFPGGTPKSVHICAVDEKAGDEINGGVSVPPYGFVTLRVGQ